MTQSQRVRRRYLNLLAMLFLLLLPVLACGEEFDDEEFFDDPGSGEDGGEVALAPTSPPPAVDEGAGVIPGQTWLIMIYSDADDEPLEQDLLFDINEAEMIGSSDRVHIVAQIDRADVGYDGDGDWTTARRYYLTQDSDTETLGSEVLMDLGEVNMADGQVLVDFVTWAVENYEADKYVLIMSDHGAGWPGGWSDYDNGGYGDHDIELATGSGDMIFLMEMEDALAQIQANTGMGKLELIGFDACLMGHVEVFQAVAPYARYAVASQELEPGVGWAYSGFLDQLVTNPDMSGAQLATAIVNTYINEDVRVSADEAPYLSGDITLTAVDLAAMPELMGALDGFIAAIANGNVSGRDLAAARSRTQAFVSYFEELDDQSYIDLGHFAALVADESGSSDVTAAVGQLTSALDTVVVAERHGSQRPGATGVSIYFPNSTLFSHPAGNLSSYTTVARGFSQSSYWDDFLVSHYYGEPLDIDVSAPPPAQPPEQPPEQAVVEWAGEIEISNMVLLQESIFTDEIAVLQADITGENIAYLYIFAGYIDGDLLIVADVDYIEADTIKEVGGVAYPDWTAEGPEILLEVEWEPLLFGVDSAGTFAPALLTPEAYGATAEEAVYSVSGIYTFAASGEQRRAVMYFEDGLMTDVYGFTGQGGVGSPREITPQTGDEFTVILQAYSLDDEGGTVELEGETITFGTDTPTWETFAAPEGEYLLGVIVEDFDGNTYEDYLYLEVK